MKPVDKGSSIVSDKTVTIFMKTHSATHNANNYNDVIVEIIFFTRKDELTLKILSQIFS